MLLIPSKSVVHTLTRTTESTRPSAGCPGRVPNHTGSCPQRAQGWPARCYRGSALAAPVRMPKRPVSARTQTAHTHTHSLSPSLSLALSLSPPAFADHAILTIAALTSPARPCPKTSKNRLKSFPCRSSRPTLRPSENTMAGWQGPYSPLP